MSSITSRTRGSLFGLAFGDALAAPTEFLGVEEIKRTWPPNGPRNITARLCRVTDDTQMGLAVGEALVAALRAGPLTPESFEGPLRTAFVRWLNDPENNRAPGNTCLEACRALERDAPWVMATVRGSKGCGANMRVTPVGLLADSLPGMSATLRSALAQFQAAITHGHPTALAASDLTAFMVTYLRDGGTPEALPGALRHYAHQQREVYHGDWLGALWQRPGLTSPEEFIARGWDECLVVLDRLDAAMAAPQRDTDPCIFTGDGWIVEEAFATAALCFLMFPDDPAAAIRRAAVTRGDSDSIAAIAGAFAGAYLGDGAWPADWYEHIEYSERLATLAEALTEG